MGGEENQRLDLPYYTPKTLESESFIMMPAVFFPQPPKKEDRGVSSEWDTVLSKLSSDEKILYCLMRQRMRASYDDMNINRFTDNQGRVFIIMEYEEMQERLHISRPTAIKLINNLEQIGAIRTDRGFNPVSRKKRPNRYYVMDVNAINKIGENHVKKIDMENHVENFDVENQVKNINYRVLANSSMSGVKNFDNSYINSNTDKRRIEEIAEAIRKQISYDEYAHFLYKHDGQEVATAEMVVADNLIKEMTEIMLSNKKYYLIGGERVSTDELKEKIKSVDITEFIVIMARLLKWGGNSKNGRAYARAVIWNAEINSLDNLAPNAQDVEIIREEAKQ